MSHSHPTGLLAAYNSLTDKHLAGYFNNTRIRRHLLRSGLITRSGRILSEKEYKLNIMKREHQKYIRECLAQAIFHKVLDMERHHQLEIKKKLEILARKERIPGFKGEHTSRSAENNMTILSPHPPLGPKTNGDHSILIDERHSSPLTLTAPRPYTAPGNMQPPIRFQLLASNPAVGTVPKITSGSRPKTSMLESEAPFPLGGKKAMMKFKNSTDSSQRMNPYQLPNISNYLMPIPPPPPPLNGKIRKENRSEPWRRRRFRPTTAPNGLEPLFTRDSRKIHKTSLHSNAAITMIYLGKNVHLSCDNSDFRDEIKVYQQHCGGENLCVYKGKLLEKETFQFISKRHHGFPFSLTFFLNGIQVNRLSSCCEYKHRKGSRLGGKRGYFGIVCVEKASPCYKCIIAMGLDTKASSSKHRKEKNSEKREELESEMKDKQYLIPRRNGTKGKKVSVSTVFSAEEIEVGVREVRTAIEEIEHLGKPGQDVWEDYQENTFKYEYEEDFEVDEEKQNEKANEEGQADDQMNGMSKSPSDDEKDNLDPEKESETSSQKAPDADDNVRDEDDGCSESELEEDKQDIKTASSASSRSHTYSSDSEDEPAMEDREVHGENSADESARSSLSPELSESDRPEKSQLPLTESFEIKIEDQEAETSDVETTPVPIQESFKKVLEEEIEKGTQGDSESLPEHLSQEAMDEKSKLWEGRSASTWVNKASLPEVEKGVGQIITEALALGYHCNSDAESGASSADEPGKPSRKLKIDTGGAPKRNTVVEETLELSLNKETKQAAQETDVLLKKEAKAEDGATQYRDADTKEGEGAAAPTGSTGITQVPLGERKSTAELPTLERFPEETEMLVGTGSATGPEVDSPGLPRKTAAGSSEALIAAEVPEAQDSVETVPESVEPVPAGEASSLWAGLANKADFQEEAVERESGTFSSREGEAETPAAVSEALSRKPDVGEIQEEALKDTENVALVGDAALETGSSSNEAVAGQEEQAGESEGLMRAETPVGTSTGEAEASCGGISEGIPEPLRKPEQVVKEVKSDREEDRKDALCLGALEVAGDRGAAERPNPAPRGTEDEGAEGKKTNAQEGENAPEGEHTPKGEEGKTVQEVKSHEVTGALQSGTESDAEQVATLTEGAEAEEACEAASGLQESLEGKIAPNKGKSEEELSEAPDNVPRNVDELQDSLPAGGVGESGALDGEADGRARASVGAVQASGEAKEAAAKEEDCPAGQGKDEDTPLVGQGRGTFVAKEDDPETEPRIAGKLSKAAGVEDPEEEEAKELPQGTGEMKAGTPLGLAEDCQSPPGGSVQSHRRELWQDPQGPEVKTAPNTAASNPYVAGEKTCHDGKELLGKTTAVEREAVEMTATQGSEAALRQNTEDRMHVEMIPESPPGKPSASGENLLPVATPPAGLSVPGAQEKQEQVVQQDRDPAETINLKT